MTNKHRTVWVIVLADGDSDAIRVGVPGAHAARVWPPKPYRLRNGGPSLLQALVRRAVDLVPRERIVVVVNRADRRYWEAQLSGSNPWSAVVQPEHRGTGFSVLLPLLVIARIDPKGMVVFLSPHHDAQDDDMLAAALRHAAAMEGTDCDRLTMLCTSTTAPDPGLGYLNSPAVSGVGMRPDVSHFEESSRELTARLLQASRGWETGIFSGCLQAVLNLYPRHVPGLLRNLQAVVKYWADPRVPSSKLQQLYAHHPAIDFWHDVLRLQPARVHFLAVPRACTDVSTLGTARRNDGRSVPGLDPLAPAPSDTHAVEVTSARNPAHPVSWAHV